MVSFDLRGHGDSERPGVYTLPHLVADLLAILTQLGIEQPVLVGHSLGGHLVTQFAAIFSDVPACVVNVEGIGPPMRESDMPLEDRQWRLRSGIQSPAAAGRARSADARPGECRTQLFYRFHSGLDYDLSLRLVELGTAPHPHGGLRWEWDSQVQGFGLR